MIMARAGARFFPNLPCAGPPSASSSSTAWSQPYWLRLSRRSERRLVERTQHCSSAHPICPMQQRHSTLSLSIVRSSSPLRGC